jgi:uncharacterized protein DUF6510
MSEDDMDDTMATGDRALATMLDANAAAGTLQEIFGTEMTALPSQCAHCGNVAEVGTTHAWMAGPGIVLRCSICHEVVMRIVDTPTARYIDARGVAYLRLPK